MRVFAESGDWELGIGHGELVIGKRLQFNIAVTHHQASGEMGRRGDGETGRQGEIQNSINPLRLVAAVGDP
ncbi:MAG: hypothetical protein AAF915_29385, partial [Cyanobacteria bacterium P01_D01_bin.50]